MKLKNFFLIFCPLILADQPYDAKYLLFVYGPKVYNNFIALARGLTSVTYQSPSDKDSQERAHILFLLLMIILLFSDGFESGFEISSNEEGQQSIDNESHRLSTKRSSSTTSDSSSSISSLASSISPTSTSKLNERLHKIQQVYIEIACRYLHDEFGLTVGRRMFQNLVPLLFGRYIYILNKFFIGNFCVFCYRSSKTLFNISQC
jgi:hypothetical protein